MIRWETLESNFQKWQSKPHGEFRRLSLLEEAERVLTLGQKTPAGILRTSVPVILGQDSFLSFLSNVGVEHPR
jgi:hypothetical protein